ncbi:MAG: trypsin-like peptidase domain-containing protein [Steroidobacteraceae bacterium]
MPPLKHSLPLLARVCGIAAAVGLLFQAASAAAPGAGYAELVRRVAPSVVTVLVEQQEQGAGERAADRALAAAANDPDAAITAILRRLLSGPDGGADNTDGGGALGSGFVIDANGLIVTNRHVIIGARAVRVRLSDAREVPAQIVGTDAATDIALLRVDAGKLPALHLGSSETTAVGDAVIAIGNPFGLGQTVTAGIISARGRTLEDDPYIDFLQTDTAINRGNSGGPLLSVDGSVLGVTSIIFSPNGGSVGLGFAIPAETVAAVVGQLAAHGRVDRGYLGVSVQALTPAIATALGLKNTNGALVTALEPEGPAAGLLRVADVILSIGKAQVRFNELPKVAARLTPGSRVFVMVMRDGTQLSVPLTVARLPDPPSDPKMGGGPDTWAANLAIGLAVATPEIRKVLKAENESGGLIVTQVRRVGAGALAGLKVGDLITHAGSKQLTEVGDLADVQPPSTKLPLLLRVVRDGAPRFMAVTGADER